MDQRPGGHGGSHLGVGVGAGGGVGGRRLAVHPDLTPFTISLLIYPIFALDFLLLRKRPPPQPASLAVLAALVLLTREARTNQLRPARRDR